MKLEIVRADPAGNITVFVLNAPQNRQERLESARLLLSDPAMKAEQVGFVAQAGKTGCLRLEMMGGEFCGNAARSFGLLLARQNKLSGKHTLTIETSGMETPLPVHIDTEAGTAEVEIPAPAGETVVEFNGREFPLYEFDGISHIIAADVEPGEYTARLLLDCIAQNAPPPAAAGVMFYDTRRRFMQPAVWVRETDTLVFESSCGSGSAALGVWTARNLRDADELIPIAQPGGVIDVRVEKQGGKVQRLSIGGQVTLGETIRYTPAARPAC